MQSTQSYRVLDGGRVMMRSPKGGERPVTDREWISLWLRDPRITLAAL
ncbi:hypothetical protein JCM17960_17380 [Magnetospira thiophila]